MPMLMPPRDGVLVRFYRIGHGDCFLLAFPKGDDDAAYVLIDCGYKPGSPKFVHNKRHTEVVESIFDACGGHLDVVVITHEHQDHVNGFWRQKNPYFEDFTIGQAWFAWTEDPNDALANQLREKHRDTLLGIAAACDALARSPAVDAASVDKLSNLLSLEFGLDDEEPSLFAAAQKDPEKSVNKQGMKLVRGKSKANPEYLIPGKKTLNVPGTDAVVYVLGPPKNEAALADEDPEGALGFPSDNGHRMGFAAAAASLGLGEAADSPFAARYAMKAWSQGAELMHTLYSGPKDENGERKPADTDEAKTNGELAGELWRQIETDWLYASEDLALALNEGINNTSLVLAFELPKTRKVLLFVGDAQAGNWLSWSKVSTQAPDGRSVDARDLLGRTVLYKVGHHGSHNATLNGKPGDAHANLEWMGRGAHAAEFTSMITAVRAWAMSDHVKWNHPLPAIKERLVQKCEGRVLQTDTDMPEKPESVSDEKWEAFLSRCTFSELYFDLTILDR